MIFYLDFEATQPENEIIAIGAVAENGATFHSLVKPQLSSISKWVSDLTHISPEDLEKAFTIDRVLVDFDAWVAVQEPDFMKCEFISYGDDAQFIKHTIPAITEEHPFLVASGLYFRIKDGTKETFKFFKGSISLLKAFNYIQEQEHKQSHNPLEDAMMLKRVYDYMNHHEPLPQHPYRPAKATPQEEQIPYSNYRIVCKRKTKKHKEYYEFNTFDEAVDWILNEKLNEKERDKTRRDTIEKNLKKAIDKIGSKYFTYNWNKVKKEVV